MIAPGAWLGVLGGGQLGRMFAMAAQRLGYKVAAVDPDPECPAAGAVHKLICAPLGDRNAWHELASLCRAVTIETENVPAAALRALSRCTRVAPGARALEVAQHRAREKRWLVSAGFEVAPFVVIDGEDIEPARIEPLLPGVLKVARNGYDGRGQARVRSLNDVRKALREFATACVLEREVELERELSVVLARDGNGAVATYPVALNRHAAGILHISVAPAPVDVALRRRAMDCAERIAARLRYEGVLCVEFFVTAAGELLVNEIAPRPHNSGHYTLDACHTSQFEQQVRVLAGLPLGDPGLVQRTGAAAMLNLLGELWQDGEPDWTQALAQPHARLHLYGKKAPRAARKMGHITCVAPSADAASRTARRIEAALARRRVPSLDVMQGWPVAAAGGVAQP